MGDNGNLAQLIVVCFLVCRTRLASLRLDCTWNDSVEMALVPTPHASSPPSGRLQDSLARLVTDARSLAIHTFDDHSFEELNETLVPTVVRLLDEATELLTEIHEAEEGWGPEVDPLCFVVRGECRDCREALRTVSGAQRRDAVRILVQAERSRHTLTRGLCAVERKLAEATSTPAATGRIDFVRESRAVRRITTELRRDLARVGDGDRSLVERVREAHRCLETLVDHGDYRELRIYDRNIVRDLRKRLASWLDDPERTPEAGRSALNEVLNFGELLRAVNDRLELVENDLEVLGEASRELADIPSGEAPPAAVVERLGTLFGRDDVLDELLLDDDVTARVLLSRVSYVRRQVSRRMGG